MISQRTIKIGNDPHTVDSVDRRIQGIFDGGGST